MMARLKTLLASMLILLPVMNQPLQAEQLYRFDNKDGIPTLSKTLPPWAVRQGYDILDENSMRLLESVPPEPTAEMREKIRQQQASEAQAAREADKQAQQSERQRLQQQRRDQTLLLTYENEVALIAARDNDLAYRQQALADLQSNQDDLRKRLFSLQTEAADNELKGQPISEQLQNKLANARQQLMFNRNRVSTLRVQLEHLKSEYQADLERYREIQSTN